METDKKLEIGTLWAVYDKKTLETTPEYLLKLSDAKEIHVLISTDEAANKAEWTIIASRDANGDLKFNV